MGKIPPTLKLTAISKKGKSTTYISLSIMEYVEQTG